MIKVIKHGKRAYFAVCGKCFCEFSYELDDLYAGSYINCPDCGFMIKHTPQCIDNVNTISTDNSSTGASIKRICELQN